MRLSPRSVWVIGVVVLCGLIALPFIAPMFWINLLTEILILGLAGMSVNLLLGYGGALPFGHAAFYATGAYAAAVLLKKTALHPAAVLIVSPFIAMALGAILGFLIARLYRFYYAMMTTAFSMLVWTLIRKLPSITNGDDGITGVKVMDALTGVNNIYFFCLIVVGLCVFLLWRIVNSPFGWSLRAIRENSVRTTFIRIDVVKHRYVAFVVSSFFCGIAGMLYVVYSHGTFPDYAYWTKSADLVMVCILGGMLTFWGPIVGAAVLTILHTLTTSITMYWPLVIGCIICLVVLLLPDGVIGRLEREQVQGENEIEK